MSEESDRAPDAATPNRGRRREPPIIDAQAHAPDAPKPPRARGAGLALVMSLLALGSAGASAWLTLHARDTSANSEAATALAQRLDRLERRVGALESKPAPVIPDTAPLAARIGSLDTKADRIAAEASRAAQMAEEALRKPVPPASQGTALDLSPLEQRIANLEQRPTAATQDETRLTKIESDVNYLRSAQSNQGPALAMIALSLRDNLERGAPLTREIAALEKLGADAKALASLKPLATQAFTATKLAQDFSAISSHILRAGQSAPEGEDFVDRLTRSANSLVRIRPLGDTQKEDVPGLVTRIEAALQRQDVASAVVFFEKLPASAQEPGRVWAQNAKARAQADAAARFLIAQAIDMMSGK